MRFSYLWGVQNERCQCMYILMIERFDLQSVYMFTIQKFCQLCITFICASKSRFTVSVSYDVMKSIDWLLFIITIKGNS